MNKVICALTLLLSCALMAPAAKKMQPIPASIINAKTAVVVFKVSKEFASPEGIEAGKNLFEDKLRKWGKYSLVPFESRPDIIITVSIGGSRRGDDELDLNLLVFANDTSTNKPLWKYHYAGMHPIEWAAKDFTEAVDVAVRAATSR